MEDKSRSAHGAQVVRYGSLIIARPRVLDRWLTKTLFSVQKGSPEADRAANNPNTKFKKKQSWYGVQRCPLPSLA